MNWIERLAIRSLEPLLDGRLVKGEAGRPTSSQLRLGRARAAFGRRGSVDVHLTIPDRLRHTLKTGATGSGKSVSEIGDRLHDLAVGQPFLELDCHDSVDKLLRVIARRVTTGRLSEKVIDNIWLVCPAHRQWCVSFNPLECPAPEAAPEKISLLMKLLEVLWGDIFGAQTKQLMQNILMLLAERQIPLVDVIGLLHDPVQLRAHAIQLVNARAKEFFLTQWFNWSPRKRIQVAEAFVNKISVLLTDPRIAAMLSSPHSDIDFRRAMDDGKTILIEISKGQFFDSVGLLASLILIGLQHATFSRGELPEERRRPYFITIEEFPSFASDVTVEPFLNESRKFGVGLNLICQTFASLDRPLLSSIRANCFTQMLFRVGPEDSKLAVAGLTGEVRELIGRELVSLPIGTAILMQGGGMPRRLQVDNVEIPKRMSPRELEIIERIRRNVGRPLDLSARSRPSERPGPTGSGAAPPLDRSSPQVRPAPKRRPSAGRAGDSLPEGSSRVTPDASPS